MIFGDWEEHNHLKIGSFILNKNKIVLKNYKKILQKNITKKYYKKKKN